MSTAGTPAELFDLTDEELAVLAGEDQGVVALPYLEELAGPARDQALHTAWRSMLARGMVELSGTSGEEAVDSGTAEVCADVSAVLHVRAGAPALLCLQRTLTEETLLRYVHLVDDTALVEDVLPEGLHRFGWLERAELEAGLQSFLVPADAVPGTGEPMTVDPQRLAGNSESDDALTQVLAKDLGSPAVLVDATVRYEGDGGPGVLLGFSIGAVGCWMSRNDAGSGGSVQLDPIGPGRVGALIAELVQRAESRAANLISAR